MYTKINAQISCNRCSHIQKVDSKHCSACGCSFVFGKPDAWTNKIYTIKKEGIEC